MMHLTIQQLVAQTDGELSGPSLKLVEKHIAECESCWHEMEQLAEQDALLASVVSIDPGDAFFEELAADVEAQISGKKKPSPRAAAPPAAPPAVARTATPPPEPVAAIRPPDRTVASPPPEPTPDDPFADLGLPSRSSAAPPPLVIAPRPPEPSTARSGPAPKPALKPVIKSSRPAPPRVQAPPAEPAPARAGSGLGPILTGVGVFIAGIAIAVLLTMRLLGIGGAFRFPPRGNVPPMVQPVNAPPVTASPEPAPVTAPEPEAPPTVQVEVPPAVIPAPAPRHAAVKPASPRPQAPPAPHDTPPRTPRPAPVDGPVSATPAPQAELGVLCGLVEDTDGKPVAGAQVMMADVGIVVLTDRAGRFCLTAPAGERTLSVAALGFTPSRRLVSLGMRTPQVSLTLKSAAPFPTPH